MVEEWETCVDVDRHSCDSCVRGFCDAEKFRAAGACRLCRRTALTDMHAIIGYRTTVPVPLLGVSKSAVSVVCRRFLREIGVVHRCRAGHGLVD